MPQELKKLSYTPILGWSATRYDTFSICKRKYYYQYYAKHDRELTLRQIDEKKELVSIPMEIGGLVHEVVKVLLSRLQKRSEAIDEDKFFDFARRQTLHSLESKSFEEAHYGDRGTVSLDDLYPKIEESLKNLLASERYGWIRREAVAASADWLIDPPGYGETRISDLKAYCKADFLFPVQGTYHIVDWKTGKQDPGKHRRQLVGYAAWATYHFEVEPETVSPVIVYLHPDYREVEETFNSFDLENFALEVRAETEEMYAYCRTVEENLPLAKSDFPMVDVERICAFCNYRGLCFPDRYPRAGQEE